MPQLDFDCYFTQIFWLVIVFGVLWLLVSKILVPNLEFAISARRLRLATLLDKVASLRKELESLVSSYQTVSSQMKLDSQKIICNAVKSISEDKSQRLSVLSEQVSNMLLDNELKMLKYVKDSEEECSQLVQEIMSIYVSNLKKYFPILGNIKSDSMAVEASKFKG